VTFVTKLVRPLGPALPADRVSNDLVDILGRVDREIIVLSQEF